MKVFRLQIVTPKGIYREDEVEIVNLRTPLGQIGILANHIPFAGTIEISQMNYICNGKREEFAVAAGMFYVSDNQITIFTNAIEAKDEIDLLRAMKSKERAEKILSMQPEHIDILRAEASLQRALVRINLKNT